MDADGYLKTKGGEGGGQTATHVEGHLRRRRRRRLPLPAGRDCGGNGVEGGTGRRRISGRSGASRLERRGSGAGGGGRLSFFERESGSRGLSDLILDLAWPNGNSIHARRTAFSSPRTRWPRPPRRSDQSFSRSSARVIRSTEMVTRCYPRRSRRSTGARSALV